MARKEQQYTSVFGPYVAGKHAIGDTIQFDRGRESGIVIWAFKDEGVLTYAVDTGGGMPVEVAEGEVVDTHA